MTTFEVLPAVDGGGIEVVVGDSPGPFLPRSTIGSQVAHGTLAEDAAAGASVNWNADAAGYTADNGLPGDRDPNKLRLPFTWPDAVSGLVIIATEDGEVYGRVRLGEGEYAATVLQLPTAGETLTLSYRRNPSGADGEGDWLECVVKDGPITSAVTVSVYESTSSPGIGVTQAQYDALNAHATRLDGEILALQQGEHSGTAPPLATDDDVDTPTGNSIRSYTTSLLARLVRAVVTRPFITRLFGGQLRDATVTGNSLTIHGYTDAGVLQTITFTPAGGQGGGGITLAQAAALLPNPPFVVDAGPPIRVTYTRPLPSNNTIARSMLTAALRDAIDAKANTSQIRPEARADLPRLTSGQLASARGRIGASSTSAVAAIAQALADKLDSSRLLPMADNAIDPLTNEQKAAARERIGATMELIAAFARAGALTNASIDHLQAILNSFEGGDWTESVEHGDTPLEAVFVGEEISNVPFTAQTIVASTYGGAYEGGAHYATAHFSARAPVVLDIPLSTIRLAIGQALLNNDHQRIPFTSDLVSLVTTTDDYRYYQIGPVNRPAGQRYAIEEIAPFELDDDLVLGGLPSGGNNDDILLRTGFKRGRWGTPPHLATPPRLLRNHSETLVVGRGAQYGVALGAAIALDSAFDLDDNPNAEIHMGVVAEITNVSAGGVNLGFVEGAANQSGEDRHREFSVIGFASRVAAITENFNPQAADTAGLRVVAQTLWSGPTIAGHLYIFLVHDALNQLGVWAQYVGVAGTETFSIRLVFDMSATVSDASSAGAGRSFALSAHPAADIDLTSLVPSDAGGWTAWATIATLPAITSAQAGKILLGADMGIEMVTASSGGGDRVDTDIRLVRTRGAVESELMRETIYGPRNMPAVAGTTSTAYSAASRRASGSIVHVDDAEEGDIFKMETAISIQRTTGAAHEVRFKVARNELLAIPA